MKKIISAVALVAFVGILANNGATMFAQSQPAQVAAIGNARLISGTIVNKTVGLGMGLNINLTSDRPIDPTPSTFYIQLDPAARSVGYELPLTKVSASGNSMSFVALIPTIARQGKYTVKVKDRTRNSPYSYNLSGSVDIVASVPNATAPVSVTATAPTVASPAATVPATPATPIAVTTPTASTPAPVVPTNATAVPAATVQAATVSTPTNANNGSTQAPVITSITPVKGGVGTQVTIIGTGFQTTGKNNILFSGKTTSAMSNRTATNNTLTFTITSPMFNECVAMQTSGCNAGWEDFDPNREYSVVVKNANGTSNAVKYGEAAPVVQGREIRPSVTFPSETVMREGDVIKFRWTPPTGLTGNDKVDNVTIRMVAYGYDEQEAGGRKLGGLVIARVSPESGEFNWKVQVPNIKDESGTGPYKPDYLQQYTFQVDFNQKTQYYNQRTKDVVSAWGVQKYRLKPASTDARPYVSMRIPVSDHGGAVAAAPGYESEYIYPKTHTFRGDADISKLPIMNFKLHSVNAASVIRSVEIHDWSLDYNSLNKSTAFASTLYLYDGTTLIGTANSQSKKFIFTGLSLAIPKDGVKTLTVKGDFPKTLAANSWAKFELKTVKYAPASGTAVYSAAPHRASGKRGLDITWLASSPITFVK